jgi:hypothetical protein
MRRGYKERDYMDDLVDFDSRVNSHYSEDFFISDREKYQLSKYFPGKYDNKCTYTPSGQMTASVPISNGFNISEGTNPGGVTTGALGSTDYCVIMY